MVLNINSVAGVVEGAKLKVTTNRTNLNIRKGPGTEHDIVGKAARHEIVTLVAKKTTNGGLLKQMMVKKVILIHNTLLR